MGVPCAEMSQRDKRVAVLQGKGGFCEAKDGLGVGARPSKSTHRIKTGGETPPLQEWSNNYRVGEGSPFP